MLVVLILNLIILSISKHVVRSRSFFFSVNTRNKCGHGTTILQLSESSKGMINIDDRINLGHLYRRLIAATISTSLMLTGITSSEAVNYEFNDLSRLKRGLREISYLIENWDDKTTYCNFGEFKMELMDAKNKDGLITAARDSGLLDKSKTMNVMCKRDPEVVRAFLGLTKENLTLQKADQLMKLKSTIEKVNPDNIDDYFEVVCLISNYFE